MQPHTDARVALLSRLLDHAPLFPPASLALEDAVAEDERARASRAAFMLGRFVCPASRLAELPDVGRGVSVVLDGPLPTGPSVQAVEVRGDELATLSVLAPEVYVEVPLDGGFDERLDAVRAHGFRAKVRCGGATTPDTEALAAFVGGCRARDLAFKANPAAFELDANAFSWRDRSASTDELTLARRNRFHSIGSCSFFEPVEELEALGVLPL